MIKKRKESKGTEVEEFEEVIIYISLVIREIVQKSEQSKETEVEDFE